MREENRKAQKKAGLEEVGDEPKLKKKSRSSLSSEADSDFNMTPEFERLDQQPAILTGGTLREHQLVGLNWLISLYELGVNGILADEMGLGKTIQAIAFLGYLAEAKGIKGHHLVVCPNSVIGNWMKEFKKWLPMFRVVKLIARKEFRAEIFEKYLKTKNFDICLTSFEGANVCKSALKKIHWQYIVVDEAHRLKNEESLLSRNLREFDCSSKLLMTGTPLQNNIKELWSLLNFIMPDLFDSPEVFETYFGPQKEQTKPETSTTETDNSKLTESNEIREGSEINEREKHLEEFIIALRRILRPFMLKRTKEILGQTLPPKKEIHVMTGLSEQQVQLYKSILLKRPMLEDIRATMNTLMQLRKCCNHPYLFNGVDIPDEDPDCEHLISSSGKMIVLDKLLKKLYGRHQVLIFSQFTTMLNVIEEYLCAREYEYCRLDGSTFIDDREKQLEEFSAPNSKKFVFLLSTRAGGLGINLYSADTVIIFDSDWNPQIDLQAMDRAHRIGQKNIVMVYRLITQNTIEEKIIERQKIKLKWDSLVLARGRFSALHDSRQSKIDKNELKDLISFGASAIFKAEGATYKDEDINLLLARGEEQAEQLSKIAESILKKVGERLFDLSMDSINIYDFAGNDFTKMKVDDEIAIKNAIEEDHKKAKLVKRVSRIEALHVIDLSSDEDEEAKNTTRRPGMKIYEHQFFPDKERLEELIGKQEKLTAEEEQEKEVLLQQGFSSWTKKDFKQFVQAIEKFGREDLKTIAEYINKGLDDVATYSEAFWRRVSELSEGGRILKTIEKADKGRLSTEANHQILKNKCEGVSNYLGLKFNPSLYKRAKSKFYTLQHDQFLVYNAYKFGPRNIDRIRAEITKEPNFRFDFNLKGQKNHIILKRLYSLFRMLSHEKELKDRLNELKKTRIPNLHYEKSPTDLNLPLSETRVATQYPIESIDRLMTNHDTPCLRAEVNIDYGLFTRGIEQFFPSGIDNLNLPNGFDQRKGSTSKKGKKKVFDLNLTEHFGVVHPNRGQVENIDSQDFDDPNRGCQPERPSPSNSSAVKLEIIESSQIDISRLLAGDKLCRFQLFEQFWGPSSQPKK